MKRTDRNCLSYWFPILLEAIPESVPKTEIIKTDVQLVRLLDGETPSGFNFLLSDLRVAGDRIGYPCFLRTGHTSGKHSWKDTCLIQSPDDFASHVAALVEFSECASIVGLPYDVWAVREFLTGSVIGTAPYYGDMPVRREFRLFVRDGSICCGHPYWPVNSLLRGGCNEDTMAGVEAMNHLGDDRQALYDLIATAAHAFPGYWSIDALWTDRGWFVTDMARGEDSWHWPGCEGPIEP